MKTSLILIFLILSVLFVSNSEAFSLKRVFKNAEKVVRKVVPKEIREVTNVITDPIRDSARKVRQGLRNTQNLKRTILGKYRANEIEIEQSDNEFLFEWANQKGFPEIANAIRNTNQDFDTLANISYENVREKLNLYNVSLEQAIKFIQAVDELYTN